MHIIHLACIDSWFDLDLNVIDALCQNWWIILSPPNVFFCHQGPFYSKKRQISVPPISSKYGPSHQNNLDGWLGLQVRGKICILDSGKNCPLSMLVYKGYIQTHQVNICSTKKQPILICKTLFTPSMCGRACAPSSVRVWTNAFSWQWKLCLKNGVNNIFSSQFGIKRLPQTQITVSAWSHFMYYYFLRLASRCGHFKSPHLLQLFRRMLQHCSAVKQRHFAWLSIRMMGSG